MLCLLLCLPKIPTADGDRVDDDIFVVLRNLEKRIAPHTRDAGSSCCRSYDVDVDVDDDGAICAEDSGIMIGFSLTAVESSAMLLW